MPREVRIVWMLALLLLSISLLGSDANAYLPDTLVGSKVPSISLEPSSGPVGTPVTIYGTFFDVSYSDIKLFFDGREIGRPDLENGTFTFGPYRIPLNLEPGMYEITAMEMIFGDVEIPQIRNASASFTVVEAWINIDPVGDKYVGDLFTITGTTNVAEGNEFLIDVTSAYFQPTEKTGEFSGASGSVEVTKGETYNEWAFDVDTETFKPDEYIVNVQGIESDVTATTTFNVLAVPTPSLTLSHQSALPGSLLTITGEGFASGASPITLTFDGSGIGTTITDEEGIFTFQYSIPSGHVPGIYLIEAVQEGGSDEFAWRRTASVDFTVEQDLSEEPSIALSPEYGEPGSVIAVSGNDYPYQPGAEILLRFENVRVGSFSLREDGTFAYHASVPAEIVPGPCEVWADEILKGELIATATADFTIVLPKQGSIYVSTNPPDAWITVDGDGIGRSPVVLDPIEPGMHTVTAEKAGYQQEEQRIQVLPGERTEVYFDLGEEVGMLEVCASCENARVYIDGRYAGTCPLRSPDMPPGTYHVMVSREGYFDYHADVSVEGNGYTYHYASMMPIWPVMAGIGALGIGGGATVVIKRIIVRRQRPKSHYTRPRIDVEGGITTDREALAEARDIRIDVEGGIERGGK